MKRMEGENVYLKNAAMKGRSGMAGVEGSKGVSCPVEWELFLCENGNKETRQAPI